MVKVSNILVTGLKVLLLNIVVMVVLTVLFFILGALGIAINFQNWTGIAYLIIMIIFLVQIAVAGFLAQRFFDWD